MTYHVELTEIAEKFIESLELKMRAKVFRTIDLLEEFGPLLAMPHARKLTGAKDLKELRVQQSNNIVRLFYFSSGDKLYIIVSGYVKKEQKTKRSEIENAITIMTTIREQKQ